MKCIAFLLCFIPSIVFAQTQKYYERTMNKFVHFYNAGMGDSVNAMFSYQSAKPLWTNKMCKDLLEEYGTITSAKYLGIDNDDPGKVHVFITQFSKAGKKTTSFDIDNKNMLGTFRFITSSDGIDKMLKNNK